MLILKLLLAKKNQKLHTSLNFYLYIVNIKYDW